MELGNNHLAVLNARMPPGYLLEAVTLPDPKRRKNEVDSLRLAGDFSQMPSAPRVPKLRERLEIASLPPKQLSSEGFRRMYLILTQLKSHPQITPFLGQMEEEKKAEYARLVLDPIDLTVIEGRLMREEYENGKQFAADVRKMWNNSLAFFPKGSDLYMATIDLSTFFETMMKGNEDIQLADRRGLHQIPKIKTSAPPKSPTISPMSLEEKKALGGKIRMLEQKYLRGIYDIVKGSLKTGINGQELEFDIDSLPPSVCRGLAEYVEICLQKSKALPKPIMTAPQVSLIPEPVAGSESSSSSGSDEEESSKLNDQSGSEAATYSAQSGMGNAWNSQASFPGL